MSDPAALVRRLRSGSRVAQLQALRGLSALAASSPEAGQAALAGGAVRAIVQLRGLRDNAAVQEGAAGALCALSAEAGPLTPAAFVEAGAIPTLVGMLQSSDGSQTVHEYASFALRSLAACDGNGAAAVVAGGAIPAVVALLQARTGQPISETDKAAAEIMLSIAEFGNGQHAMAVIEAGGLPALLALLDRHGTAGAVGYVEASALVAAAAALGELAGHSRAAHEAVAAAGSVRRMVGLVSHSYGELQETAADVLRILLIRCPVAQAAFAELRAAPAVVRLLGNHNQQVQQLAAGVLGNAACDSKALSAAILAAGAVLPLVRLLCTLGHPAREWAATTVQNLCAMQPATGVPAFMQVGGPAALAQLLVGSDDEHVKGAASRALDTIAYALQTASQWQGSGSSQSAASSTEPGSGEAAPAAEVTASPPRMCAAPGCGATHGLKRCSGCGRVRYCSAACQREHWLAHKAECRRLQAERAATAGGGGEA